MCRSKARVSTYFDICCNVHTCSFPHYIYIHTGARISTYIDLIMTFIHAGDLQYVMNACDISSYIRHAGKKTWKLEKSLQKSVQNHLKLI